MNEPVFPEVPPTLGVYAVEELVVTSAFSRVFRGRDRLLGRPVAIKVFTLSEAKEERLPYDRDEWRRRFVAEARLLAQIDHPNVIRVDALGYLADGTPYMVMPWYVANLRREIGRDANDPDRAAALPEPERPRSLTPERTRSVIRQLCLGLAALHARNLVHRDVKPTNLLLTARENGDVRLCDLGFARRPGGGAASRAGVWIGTPNYCAPEQREDASRVTDRADIYAVGVLAYRLLTGALPVGAFAPVGHAGFDQIIRGAMAPRPADRPTAVELAAQLHRLQP
ncbi:MAG: serine/threonine protein kinase [Alphaproteobacteria bacterium]|nr:serine/threonine protein kinase [Alphaproteobacteria bacterium]